MIPWCKCQSNMQVGYHSRHATNKYTFTATFNNSTCTCVHRVLTHISVTHISATSMLSLKTELTKHTYFCTHVRTSLLPWHKLAHTQAYILQVEGRRKTTITWRMHRHKSMSTTHSRWCSNNNNDKRKDPDDTTWLIQWYIMAQFVWSYNMALWKTITRKPSWLDTRLIQHGSSLWYIMAHSVRYNIAL